MKPAEEKIQTAYRGIIHFMIRLQTLIQAEYPNFEVSGVYRGYMDMTYFAFSPVLLSNLSLDRESRQSDRGIIRVETLKKAEKPDWIG